MKQRIQWILGLIVTVAAFNVSASEQAVKTEPAPRDSGPISALVPDGVRWPGVVVTVIGGMFVAAAAVGIVVRLNSPAEEPAAHHDDHDARAHGSSGHGAHH